MQTPIHELETPRLRMRQWLPADREPFARLSADPQVMRYFPTMMNRQEADSFADRMQGKMQANGWGFWVLERKSDGQFLGFTGLNNPPAELPFSPCVEIGWRLTRESWGLGYASEAATRALDFAFEKLDTDKVYAFTAMNCKSICCMPSPASSGRCARLPSPCRSTPPGAMSGGRSARGGLCSSRPT